MILNSEGRCEHCRGLVRNIPGRRLTREQLAEVHRGTCPGLKAPPPRREQ